MAIELSTGRSCLTLLSETMCSSSKGRMTRTFACLFREPNIRPMQVAKTACVQKPSKRSACPVRLSTPLTVRHLPPDGSLESDVKI